MHSAKSIDSSEDPDLAGPERGGGSPRSGKVGVFAHSDTFAPNHIGSKSLKAVRCTSFLSPTPCVSVCRLPIVDAERSPDSEL